MYQFSEIMAILKFPEWLTILIFLALIFFIALHIFVIWFCESKEVKKSNNPYRLLFIFLLIYFLFDRGNSQSFVLWSSFISYSSVMTQTFEPLICQIIVKFCILCIGNYTFYFFGIQIDLISINKVTICSFLKGLLMEEFGGILRSLKVFSVNLPNIKLIRGCVFYSCTALTYIFLYYYYHNHYNQYSAVFYEDIFKLITCIMYYQIYSFVFSKVMNYIFFPIVKWKYQITANNNLFKYQQYIIIFCTVISFYLIWNTISDILLKYYGLLYLYRFCVYKIPTLILSDAFLQIGRFVHGLEPQAQSMTNESISDALSHHGAATKDDLLIVGYTRMNENQLLIPTNINRLILRFYDTPKWDTLHKMDIGDQIKFFNNSRTCRWNGTQTHFNVDGYKLVISNEVFNSDQGKDKIFVKLKMSNKLINGYPSANIAILPQQFLNWFMGLNTNNNYNYHMIDGEFRALPGFWELHWITDNIKKSKMPSSVWDVKKFKNKMLSGSNEKGDVIKIKFDFVKMKAICWKNKVKKEKTFPLAHNTNYKIIVNISVMGDEVTLLY